MYINIHLIIETYSVSLCTSYSGNEAVTGIKVFSV